jgi:hypothetical protein
MELKIGYCMNLNTFRRSCMRIKDVFGNGTDKCPKDKPSHWSARLA